MNLNGGCARTEDLEALDGTETAYLLIDSGAGTVTPYGVAYDNSCLLYTSGSLQTPKGYGEAALLRSLSAAFFIIEKSEAVRPACDKSVY